MKTPPARRGRLRRKLGLPVCLGLPVWLGIVMLAATTGARAADTTVHTDALNYDPLVREAYQHFYILDYDGALARFQKVLQQHPEQPLAVVYVLDCTLFRELYRLDLLDTTFYATDGFLTGRHQVEEDPAVKDQVWNLENKAEVLANARLKVNARDTDALFARGFARALKATYLGMVERGFSSGLHLALQARSDNSEVLKIDPDYVDAKMIVGIYEYVVGALPLPFKFLVGFAGIHGSKEKGMAMLQDAASRGVATRIESQTTIALFLRREAKYQQAIEVVRRLEADYPRGFLFGLEEANLEKDSGQAQRAIAAYRNLLETGRRKDYFPSQHLELAWFGLADSLRGQKQYADAAAAYYEAANQKGTGPELKRRSLVAAGNMYDLMHERQNAERVYRAAIVSSEDSPQAEQARKYLHSAYSGR